jgi:ADP-ribosyl-[dinitrogen reductase] hydrolase
MKTHREGLIIGSLVGDALGVPVEFVPRQVLQKNPVIDMRQFGTHNQPKGTWSDDGSLMLCSLETLIKKEPPIEALKRFERWLNGGYWTALGEVFDIGNTTADALAGYMQHGVAHAPSGPNSNGNGSLMRIAPLALFIDPKRTQLSNLYKLCKEWSELTHGNEVSVFCCFFYVIMTSMIITGQSPRDAFYFTITLTGKYAPKSGECDRLLNEILYTKPVDEIKSGGYVVDTLEASIWCALNSTDYKSGVLKAVNLGDDSDTTACVTGGILGAYYGMEGIPTEWIVDLARINDIKFLLDTMDKDYDKNCHYLTEYEFDGTNWVPVKKKIADKSLTGYNGLMPMDTAFVYAPYIPILKK